MTVPTRVGSFEFAAAEVDLAAMQRYVQQGYTPVTSLSTLLRRNGEDFGALPAVIDGEQVLTWAELSNLARRFGGYLQSRGVGRGDVVLWQLPNWWEAVVVAWGIWAAGAISAPVVTIYREQELTQLWGRTNPRCVIMPASFRGFDHLSLARDVERSAGSQDIARVVVRGASPGWVDFADTVRALPAEIVDPLPDDPAVIGMTSGTTSGAKLVVHSAASILSNPTMMRRQSAYGWRDRAYMPAPLAHATGLLTVVGVPAVTGCSVVLRDHWDAELAVQDIRKHAVTFSSGAAVFLRELVAAVHSEGLGELRLRSGYPCGGSAIPTDLALEADALGIGPARSYGMTECTGVTYSSPFESPEVRCGTDGRVTPGCEVRVVDDEGRDVTPGEPGEFLVKGPHRALGYLDPEHTAVGFDSTWFRSGDIGVVTEDGILSVTGRIKDIINRGGEKISAREIEELLATHPGVTEAAVVPVPHDRLGEQPAAFVKLSAQDTGLVLEDLREFLLGAGLAPQKVPNVWHKVDSFPTTPLGKIRKSELRPEP